MDQKKFTHDPVKSSIHISSVTSLVHGITFNNHLFRQTTPITNFFIIPDCICRFKSNADSRAPVLENDQHDPQLPYHTMKHGEL